MKIATVAGILVVLASIAGSAVAHADSQRDHATAAVKQMLAAIAHPDYKAFVAPTTEQFRKHADAKKFPIQAASIDKQIPLAQPYKVKFIATQRKGATLGYIYEVTLHDGDQVLVEVTLEGDKISSFHLL